MEELSKPSIVMPAKNPISPPSSGKPVEYSDRKIKTPKNASNTPKASDKI